MSGQKKDLHAHISGYRIKSYIKTKINAALHQVAKEGDIWERTCISRLGESSEKGHFSEVSHGIHFTLIETVFPSKAISS